MSPSTGAELRDEGMQLAADAAPPTWTERARAALMLLARAGVEFTSEDIVDIVGLPHTKAGANTNNAVGALFAHAARQGLITKVGAVNAERPVLHAAEVKVWKGIAT